YAFKDTEKTTLKPGEFVVLTVKSDPNFPARGLGYIQSINWAKNEASVQVLEEYRYVLEEQEDIEAGVIDRSIDVIEKPLEIFYEQIAKRNASGLSRVEETTEKQQESFDAFYKELFELNFVPAGRVLYGAGSNTDVTYFNCYVMPYVKDSREGI